MENRTALVTGASKGIGREIAGQLAGMGYKVIAPGHEELDLSSESSVESYTEKNKNVSFDIIINNAGINEINDIENITDEEIERTMQINLISPLKLIRAFITPMKKNRFGRIVNIGSIWGIVSKRGRLVYSATKHGIHGITKTVAVEGAEYNILCNTVCPGFTLTKLTEKNNTEEEIRAISEKIPMKRMALPCEIARVVCFLAGEDNTYLTGQLIAVDGGYTSI
ncbi:MAG: SDR family NAD(P)-dependent oxidoreductase [Porcipelethomonas sp.]